MAALPRLAEMLRAFREVFQVSGESQQLTVYAAFLDTPIGVG